MEAKERSFIFMNTASYYDIPFFQRAYVWGESEWEALLTNFLDNTESNFLGSIILKQEPTKSGEPSRYMVIDGQQRLTTLSILLRACYDRLMEEPDKYEEDVVKGFGNDLNSLLFIKPDKFSTKADVKIHHSKLDKQAYQSVINGEFSDYKFKESDPRHKDESLSRIIKGYFYFRDELHTKGEGDIRVIWNLLTTDDSKFLVNIDLGANENEQKIFDTVNSTGVRLTSADTIKNALFQKYIDVLRTGGTIDVDKEASNLYEITWDKAFSEDDETRDYWETARRYGRLSRDNIEVFLNAFAVINDFFDPSIDNVITLPQKYKDRISAMNREELERFLEILKKHADVFRKYFNAFDNETLLSFADYKQRLLHLCHALDVATFYPFILKLLYQREETNELDEEVLKKTFADLERYIVLNAICGGSTKNYNNECVQLVKNRRMPKDLCEASVDINRKAFNAGLRNMRQNKIPTAILFWVELYNRFTKYSDIRELKYNYTLEHIMPQKWKVNWAIDVLPVYNVNKQVIANERDAEEERGAAVYEIGNMTLLNSKLNSSLSNNTFQKKVNGDGQKYKYCMKDLADLYLTREVIDKQSWDERNIRERTSELQAIIETIWGIDFPEDKPVKLDFDIHNQTDSFYNLFSGKDYPEILSLIERSDLSDKEKALLKQELIASMEYELFYGYTFWNNDKRLFSKPYREVVETLSQNTDTVYLQALLAADNGYEDEAVSRYSELLHCEAETDGYILTEDYFCTNILVPVKNALPRFYAKLKEKIGDIEKTDSVEKLMGILDEYYSTEDLDKRLELIGPFIEVYESSYVGRVFIAQTMYDKKDWDNAIYHMEILVKSDEECLWWKSSIFYNLGSVYYNIQNYEKSVEYYKKATEVYKDDDNLYNNIGWSYYRMEQYEKALEYFDESMKHNPTNTYACNNKARALIYLQRYDELREYIDNPPRVLRKGIVERAEKALAGIIIDESKDDEINDIINDEINDEINDLGLAILNVVKKKPGIKVQEIVTLLKPDIPDVNLNKVRNEIRMNLQDYIVYDGTKKKGGYFLR